MSRWFRRLCFKLAFRGFKADDPKAIQFVRDTLDNKSIENELRTERALELVYWARHITR